MSTCKRMTVYAMGLDREGNIATATNYNETECTNEVGNCGCIHAEDALLRKMPNPVSVSVSHAPCIKCAEKLIGAGVEVVYYLKPYRKTEGIQLLRKHNIVVLGGLPGEVW